MSVRTKLVPGILCCPSCVCHAGLYPLSSTTSATVSNAVFSVLVAVE